MGNAGRDVVLMSSEDAGLLSVEEGDRVRLESETGKMVCTVHFASVKSRTLQVYWPEGNALISRRVDPISGEPDYNTVVKVRRA